MSNMALVHVGGYHKGFSRYHDVGPEFFLELPCRSEPCWLFKLYTLPKATNSLRLASIIVNFGYR